MSKYGCDRFGKVFVKKRSTNGSSTDSTYEELKGAKFSNLQLNIVGEKEKYQRFQGKFYSVRLFGQLVDMAFPLGESRFIDESTFEPQFNHMRDALLEFAVFDKSNDKKWAAARDALLASQIHIWAALCAAGEHSADLRLWGSMYALTAVDDTLEAVPESASAHGKDSKKKAKSYKDISQVAYEIAKVFRAAEEWTVEDVFEKFGSLAKTRTPHEQLFYGTLATLFKDIVETGARYGCSPKTSLEDFADWVEFVSLEYSSDWKLDVLGNAEKAAVAIPIITETHYVCFGGLMTLEVLLIHNGIHIDEDLRLCPLYKLIKYFMSRYAVNINDLFSFDKELDSPGHEWRGNEGCMLHKTKGYSIEEAKAKLAQNANESTAQVRILCDMLLNSWREDGLEQVKGFVNGVYHILTVTIQGQACIPRYVKGVSMDMYIDDV